MKITRLRTRHVDGPVGFAMERPVFSYTVEDSTGRRQRTARIRVAEDPAMERLIYDSGEDESISPLAFPLPEAAALSPGVRYWWDVSVRADDGDFGVSEPAFFETAADMPSLAGEMIACGADLPVCEFFTSLTLDGPPARARAYVTALGVFELRINGQKAGEEYLTPYSNDYDSWQQVITFDVGGLLRPGENEIAVTVAPGWYSGYFGFEGKNRIYGDRLAAFLHMDLWNADGTSKTLCTDGTWRARECAVRSAEIYHGEVYDPGFVPARDYAVEVLPYDKGKLSPRRSLPVTVRERLRPRRILHTPKGETVVDLGQNMVGWLAFRCREPAGTRVHLQYGEVLQNGCFYRDNLRTARAEFTYISDGTERMVRPHLTYYGFRYVKIEGITEPLSLDDLCGEVICSAMDVTGSVETGHPLVNRLFLNALWGQKGNFVDVPSDCPQRDERMGWTGDAQVFSETALYNMDAYAFYAKYGYDMLREQEKYDGCVPMVIPSFHMGPGGACAWADAATVIPWNTYLFTGDKSILAQQYPSMKGWTEWVRARDRETGDKGLWQTGFHFGDWLAPDGTDPSFPTGATDVFFVASAYYCRSAALTAKAAGVLGLAADAADYGRLADRIRAAIQKEYFTEDGQLTVRTQTGYALTLAFGLCPDGHEQEAADALAAKLRADGGRLMTGFVGTPCICRALSEHGYHELACSLMLRPDCPGWLYPVRMGATTIWERWDSILPDGTINPEGMNSLNHYAYGSIAAWMYGCLGGLAPMEEAPGFARIRWTPMPDGRLGHMRVRCAAAAGTYESAWRVEDGRLELRLTVPFGCQAEVCLPDAPETGVACNGAPWENKALGPGTYTFAYTPARLYDGPCEIPPMIMDI